MSYLIVQCKYLSVVKKKKKKRSSLDYQSKAANTK